MRLHKYISKCGVTSRRKAESLIEQGKVKVNGNIITEMGMTINPVKDIVTVNNKRIYMNENKIYIKLNKPRGYVTTMSDQFNRPTVMDLVKDIDERIYPVGRLDFNTSGLLLLTNDGDLTNKITHPRNHIDKTYIATVKGKVNFKDIKAFEKGIDIGGYITAPGKLEILKVYNDKTDVKIIIHEGKNRQIRRMMKALGHPVLKLKRIAIGKIDIKDLEIGKWRFLNKTEIDYLKSY